MITSHEKLYYNYRMKEISREIQQASLLREVLQAKVLKPSLFKNLMRIIGKQLVHLGSRMENRYDVNRQLECCA